jgi:UDP-glucose 4-epimerase
VAILVTGGTGFIGSYLTRHLVLERGRDDVVVFDRFPHLGRIDEVVDRITLVEGDVLEPQELMAAIARHDVDRIAHLAFLPGSAHPEKIVPYLRTQIIGTANVFEAARLAGITRVVQASSVAVYGGVQRDRPVAEDVELRPADWYGTCKQTAEQIAALYNAQHGMEVLSLRICASLGYGRLGRSSLASGLTFERVNFLAAPEVAFRGQPVTMPPDDQPFDVLYAADTAEAWCCALDAPRPEHSVFNLRAEQRRVGEMTAQLRRLLPEAEIAVSDAPVPFTTLVDNTRLVTELGFEPHWTLETALEDYVEQIRRREPRPQ